MNHICPIPLNFIDVNMNSPINTVKEAFAMEQTKATHMIETVEHATIGQIPLAGIPVKFEQTPSSIRSVRKKKTNQTCLNLNHIEIVCKDLHHPLLDNILIQF